MHDLHIISHRGNLDGPFPEKENNPTQIMRVFDRTDYDVEVDVWLTEGQFYLGHDKPQYKVAEQFLECRRLWLHAKNFDALAWLNHWQKYRNAFWHKNDDYCVTSLSYVWALPTAPNLKGCIVVMPEWQQFSKQDLISKGVYGVCTDYPARYT